MPKISVVASVFNAERSISRLLESVKWADEIIVIDNSSSDNTAKIARHFTSKVYTEPNRKMLNLNKNFGFEKAGCEWILNLDGDEEIPPDLKSEIIETLKNKSNINGYWIPRQNIIFGKWIKHGLWWPDKQLRLFKKNSGKFPGVHVHEYLNVEGEVAELSTPFIHYNYETISQFLQKMSDIYTDNEVDNLIAADYHYVWQDAIKFPLSDFVKIYLAQEGYKDGLHGLVLAILQSFYSFIVFTKMWEKQGFKPQDIGVKYFTEEFKKSNMEIKYWLKTVQISDSRKPLSRFLLRLQRKLNW
jgi:(heptosyl)LPS beta-1,4-glucosyltransferase